MTVLLLLPTLLTSWLCPWKAHQYFVPRVPVPSSLFIHSRMPCLQMFEVRGISIYRARAAAGPPASLVYANGTQSRRSSTPILRFREPYGHFNKRGSNSHAHSSLAEARNCGFMLYRPITTASTMHSPLTNLSAPERATFAAQVPRPGTATCMNSFHVLAIFSAHRLGHCATKKLGTLLKNSTTSRSNGSVCRRPSALRGAIRTEVHLTNMLKV